MIESKRKIELCLDWKRGMWFRYKVAKEKVDIYIIRIIRNIFCATAVLSKYFNYKQLLPVAEWHPPHSLDTKLQPSSSKHWLHSLVGPGKCVDNYQRIVHIHFLCIPCYCGHRKGGGQWKTCSSFQGDWPGIVRLQSVLW